MFSSMFKKKGIIICGFAGIGKTNFSSYVPNFENVTYYDLQSSYFRKNEGWEKTYIDCAEALAEKYDYVFLSTHDMAIDELISRGAKFYIVYPKAHCKFEYMQRFKDRGNSQEYIDKFMKNWDSFIARLDRLEINNKVTLRTGQYLSDVIERLR